MLINKKELNRYLEKKYGDEELFLNTIKSEDIRTPWRYEGLNVMPSKEYLEVWDSVGCMVEVFGIYKPKGKGGTRLYCTDGVYFK